MKREKVITNEKSDSENLYSIEINLDGGEDDLSIMSAHLTSVEKQYIFKSAEELRDLDERIRNDIQAGNTDTIEYLQALYNDRLFALCSYMDKMGISYSMNNKKRSFEEKRIAEKRIAQKNHNKSCDQCKRHVPVRREAISRNRGYERELSVKK